MFTSFFPRPKLFFWSVIIWAGLAIALWFVAARDFGVRIGLAPAAATAPPVGVGIFFSGTVLWFCIYYTAAVGLFTAFWRVFAPHPWWRWSILGSALILFLVY